MYPMDAKIVTLLLESGANPFCADKKGQSGSPMCQSVSPICQSVICLLVFPVCHFLFICCSFWSHYHWHLLQGARSLLSHQACRQSDFLSTWGLAFHITSCMYVAWTAFDVQPLWPVSPGHLACFTMTLRCFQSQNVYFNSDMSTPHWNPNSATPGDSKSAVPHCGNV